MKLLLHICCAGCACYPVKLMEEKKDIRVTGFWYNPNIHPYTEYQKRLMALGYYAQKTSLPVICEENYPMEEWFHRIGRDFEAEDKRCPLCYSLRIEKTACAAKEKGFDAFSTTLLYSKHQNRDLIRKICEEQARKYGLKFYDEDFHSGWKEGIEISKEMGLYRQNYCGCIFSEKERHLKR